MAMHTDYSPQREPQAYGGAADIDEEDKAWERERPYRHQYIPDQPQRLGVFSVVCIISNRMIGQTSSCPHCCSRSDSVRRQRHLLDAHDLGEVHSESRNHTSILARRSCDE